MSVLRVEALRVARGAREVLADVSLQAERGEIVALMGRSGSGKTTVLRSVAGLDPFDGGAIQVGETTLAAATDPRQARRLLHQKVGMVFQFHSLFEHLTAEENVALAPEHVQRRTPREAARLAREALAHLGVEHRAAALPRELSGGEAQRVAIARALVVDPPLLLLDEPTASLDPARCGELGRTLQHLAGEEGRTLVITSHDDEFVASYATRVVVLAGGVVVESGPARDVLTRPSHPQTAALLHRRAP